MSLPKSDLTPDNCAFFMIDHQVGLMGAVRQTSPSNSIHLTSMSTRSLKSATR